MLTEDLSSHFARVLALNLRVSRDCVIVIDYEVIAADRVRVCYGLEMCEELNANVHVSQTGLFSPSPRSLIHLNMSVSVY